MQNIDAKQLLDRYRRGIATENEINDLLNWIQNFESKKQITLTHADLESVQDEMWLHLSSLIENPKKIKIWPRLAVAASILLFLSFGAYLLFSHQPNRQTAEYQKNDIAPGSNKAILTLANGHQIVLTNAKNTKLAEQANTTINKKSGGQVVYTQTSANDKTQLVYNTMTTPRGGKFELTLSDGTQVTLNAASSIRYPVSFSANERKVEITGEVYFEVAHNKYKPFLVTSKNQTVQVLGTHFNINAYEDEPDMKTTLLEGLVKVYKDNQIAMLKPGQQSVIQFKNQTIMVQGADVEEAVAWKNGFFKFKNANIQKVMRQFSRWYDVDVEYQGNIPEKEFSGEITRQVNASQVLDILSFFKVNFRIEKRNSRNKIIVNP